MSLFERIQNKRYNLQEAPIDDKGNITPEPGEVKKSEKILKKFIKKQKKKEQKNIKSNTQAGEQLKKDINKRLSASTTKGDQARALYGTGGGSTEGAGGANTGTTPPKPKITGDVTTNKGVNQADVSKKAQEFTKKINKQRIVKQKNIFGGEDTVKTKNKTTSGRSKGTRTKTPVAQGQKKINLGTYTKGKVQPTQTLKPGGVIKTDLRTVPKKPRSARKRSPLAKPPKPEKMVVVKDPITGGFKKVGATTKEGSRVLRTKQSISTDELLGNQKKIEKEVVKNKKKIKVNKNTPKPNLFSKVKSKLKGFHQYMVKDAGTRKTSQFPGYGRNVTRTTYKNTLKGNTLKNINKILPGKYKALALAAAGTAIAVDQVLKNRKAAASGVDTKKPVYKKAVKTLNLDTGKKNN